MTQYLIFDLSEVLIAGLAGIEKELSEELPIPEENFLPCFAGNIRDQLFIGYISEDNYLRQIIAREKWQISLERLKEAIRNNFHNEVEGTQEILTELASKYDLVLLSDHAREWIDYIEEIHRFLNIFKHTFFSYNMRRLKKDPKNYLMVLNALSVSPQDCLFIDDNPENIEAALFVKIPGIRFINAVQLKDEFGKRGLL